MQTRFYYLGSDGKQQQILESGFMIPDFLRQSYHNHINKNSNLKIHRINGPAVYNDSHKEYFENGFNHRLDGPAIENKKFRSFYIEGKLVYTKDFAIKTNHLICDWCFGFCKQECFLF